MGVTCPGGTAVSAECASRSRFDENPCACTALQQLAALSSDLQAEAPWADLANSAYCQTGILEVRCAPVDGVELPTYIFTSVVGVGLAGALPPSLREMGYSLAHLNLYNNAISSLPTELGALTGLTYLGLAPNAITSLPTELAALTGLNGLYLFDNQLTGFPEEFRTWGPSGQCNLYNNPGFSYANVGAGTSCCTTSNCGDVGTCYSG